MANDKKSASTDSLNGKSKKQMKKAQREMKNTSLAKNKFAGILGLFVIVFGIFYVVFLGTYVYKRKTGQTTSALRHENPFANLGKMEALKHAFKIDENGKVVFAGEDMEQFRDILGENFGKKTDEENVEEVGNEAEEDAPKEDTPKEDAPKEDAPKEDAPKENEKQEL